jgi:hypothetical protein
MAVFEVLSALALSFKTFRCAIIINGKSNKKIKEYFIIKHL